MKIAFTLQSTNQTKHPNMPDAAPYLIYEIADERQAEFEGQGYSVLSPEDFNTYQSTIDFTAYNAATATPITTVIDNAVAASASKGKELADKFKRENILMGISAPQNVTTLVAVAKKVHWVEHFMLGGSLRGAIAELDTVAASDLTGLSPFITVNRLTAYKNELQDYLGITRT